MLFLSTYTHPHTYTSIHQVPPHCRVYSTHPPESCIQSSKTSSAEVPPLDFDQFHIPNQFPNSRPKINASTGSSLFANLAALGTRPITLNPSFSQMRMDAGLLAKTRLNTEYLYPYYPRGKKGKKNHTEMLASTFCKWMRFDSSHGREPRERKKRKKNGNGSDLPIAVQIPSTPRPSAGQLLCPALRSS